MRNVNAITHAPLYIYHLSLFICLFIFSIITWAGVGMTLQLANAVRLKIGTLIHFGWCKKGTLFFRWPHSTNIACDAVVWEVLLSLSLFSFYAPIVASFGEMVGLVNRINYDKHVYKSHNTYRVQAVLCTYICMYICLFAISLALVADLCQLLTALSLLICAGSNKNKSITYCMELVVKFCVSKKQVYIIKCIWLTNKYIQLFWNSSKLQNVLILL